MNSEDLAVRISDIDNFDGYQLECQPIPGEIDVLQITVAILTNCPRTYP